MAAENPVLHRLDDYFITLHTFINYMLHWYKISNVYFVCEWHEQTACDVALRLLLCGHQMSLNFIYKLNVAVNEGETDLRVQKK